MRQGLFNTALFKDFGLLFYSNLENPVLWAGSEFKGFAI